MPTFPHVPKGILIGFVRAHASLHVRRIHAGLVGRVGCQVLARKSRVVSLRERILEVNTAPTEKQRCVWGKGGWKKGNMGQKEIGRKTLVSYNEKSSGLVK